MARFLPVVLVVALLGGSAAAFAVTERLKLVRSPVFATQVGKVVSPDSAQPVAISFRMRKPDRLTLTIVDSNDRVVRTLIDSRHFGRGKRSETWDGRDAYGTPVADGAYRPRVHLAGQHRTIVLPNPIVVDTKKPRISLVRTSLKDVSPDGDARNDYLSVFFKTSEPARAVLYENGRRVVLLKSFKATKLLWGRRNGLPTRPGAYSLRLAAIDQAGNLGPRSRVFTVRIRYIALPKKTIRARAGGRIVAFVSTDAHGYSWRIGPRRGRAGGRRLVLAAGAPGRYRLVVSERGHKAAATVVVSP